MDIVEIRKKVIEKEFCNMNDRQFEAVTTVNGPLLVLAGAGSGKTTVLVNRIANLIKYGNAYQSNEDFVCKTQDVEGARDFLEGRSETFFSPCFSVDAPKPWEILAITFTNKAADELKSRINAKLGEGAEGIWAGTFHSVCGKILRYNAERIGYTPHFTIYDTDDQKRVIKDIIKQNNLDEKMYPVKAVLTAISHCKDALVTVEEFAKTNESDLRLKKIAEIYKEYQRRLISSDAMDFDDMISNTVKLFSQNSDVLEYYGNKFRYIMVDEYQDTNHAQYELVRLLGSVHKNVCVVGDDDQSIYRFRGATIENILNFEDDYDNAKVIRLERNYRSYGNILNAANSVIKNNLGRKGKTLWTDAGDGELIDVHVAFDERGEARYVADKILETVKSGGKFSSNAVLYRTNAQSAAVENVFARSGISYRVIGGFRFYERAEIKDVLAYLNVINNSNDNVRLKRIINEPKRGIGDTTVARAQEIADSCNMSLFEVFRTADAYPLISKAAAKLRAFCDMISNLKVAAEDMSLGNLVIKTVEDSGYLDSLRLDKSPESAERIKNIEELVASVRAYEEENEEPTLSGFLEEVALVSDIDSFDTNEDKVTLMTVHSAKGLEFDNVFLIGMEDGLFPSSMATMYGGNEELEEERRLAYVAITRAKKKLHITRATTRMRYGSTDRNMPSKFLREIPKEYIKESNAPEISFGGYGGRSGYGGYGAQGYERAYKADNATYTARRAYDYPTASDSQKPTATQDYKVGQTITHATFGKGMILSLTAMGNDTLMEIAFETAGTKKIMANYAKLSSE